LLAHILLLLLPCCALPPVLYSGTHELQSNSSNTRDKGKESRPPGSEMATTAPTVRKAAFTDKAPAPLPVFSQAIIANGIIYVSGNVGIDPATGKLVDGGVRATAVCLFWELSLVDELERSS